MVVTWRDGGLWILPESTEEHSALVTLRKSLGGVLGAYKDLNGDIVIPEFRPVEKRHIYWEAPQEASPT